MVVSYSSDKNGGYSYGNNYGAFYLIDKYMVDILVIANPDVEFTEAFLIRIVQDTEKPRSITMTWSKMS